MMNKATNYGSLSLNCYAFGTENLRITKEAVKFLLHSLFVLWKSFLG